MTSFLDDLARTMARPMPRKRAVRVFGAAALGVWFGGAARIARGANAAHVCDTRVSKEGWKYCTPASQACFPTCCPKEWACCKGKCGNNGCCEMFCCNPCNPKSSRCVGAGVCGQGPVRNDCCVRQGVSRDLQQNDRFGEAHFSHGRVVRAGPDGAIGMEFDAQPNAAIRLNGTFAFTAKVSSASGLAPHTVTVRGTFYGNNVLARARGRSTATKFGRYSSCSGDQPFWAKRIG